MVRKSQQSAVEEPIPASDEQASVDAELAGTAPVEVNVSPAAGLKAKLDVALEAISHVAPGNVGNVPEWLAAELAEATAALRQIAAAVDEEIARE